MSPNFKQAGLRGHPQLLVKLYLPATHLSLTLAGGARAPQLAKTRLILHPPPNIIVNGQWISESLQVFLKRCAPSATATAENKCTATLLYK